MQAYDRKRKHVGKSTGALETSKKALEITSKHVVCRQATRHACKGTDCNSAQGLKTCIVYQITFYKQLQEVYTYDPFEDCSVVCWHRSSGQPS